jgi:hypothetical protein
MPTTPTSMINRLMGVENWTDSITFTNGAGINGASAANGSVSGNTTYADNANLVFNATTGTMIGTAANQKLGFYGATPVVQPAGAGEAAGAAGLQANNVATVTYVANTSNFSGNTGNAKYTINDIVKALKQAGFLTP